MLDKTYPLSILELVPLLRRQQKMTQDSQQAPVFRIDVTTDSAANEPISGTGIVVELLQRLLETQERQVELLEDLSSHLSSAQRQRAIELNQWREANPELARACRVSAEALSRVQAEFLHTLTEEVLDSEDHLVEGDFMLNEFVDRFGPRLAHLNGVLQVLSQLSAVPTTP